MWKVYAHLKSLVDSKDFFLNKIDYKMQEKFAKYWGHSFEKVNMLLIVANVRDPLCKLDFVIWYFSSLYDTRKVGELRVNIKELLFMLFESYGGESNPNRGERSSVVPYGATNSYGSFNHFTQFRKMKEVQMMILVEKMMLKNICQTCESASNSHFDILTWWKLNWP